MKKTKTKLIFNNRAIECKLVSRPNVSIQEIVLDDKIIPGKVEWSNIELLFDPTQETTKELLQWIGGVVFDGDAMPVAKDIVVYCVSHTVTEEWTLHNTWPVALTFDDINDPVVAQLSLKVESVSYKCGDK